jgi:hypothetical protein
MRDLPNYPASTGCETPVAGGLSNAVAGCHIVFNLASTSSPGNYNLSPAADVFDNAVSLPTPYADIGSVGLASLTGYSLPAPYTVPPEDANLALRPMCLTMFFQRCNLLKSPQVQV